MVNNDHQNIWHGKFIILFTAYTISSVGDRLSFVVLPFLILAAGGGATTVALALGSRSVGFAISVLAGGILADSLGPRRALLISEILRSIVQLGVVLVFLSPSFSATILCLLAGIYGLAEGIATPSSRALLPRVVADRDLEQANGYMSVSYTSGHLIGPVIAGVLVASDLGVLAIAIDAVSFVIGAALIFTLEDKSSGVAANSRHSALRLFNEGVETVFARRWLIWLFLASLVLHLTSLPAVYALGPVWSDTSLGGATAWGTLVTVFGIGGVLGGLVATKLRSNRPICWYFISLIPIAAQPIFIGSGYPLWAIAALQCIAGFSLSILSVMEDVSIQRGVPSALVARVGSLATFVSTVTLPIGYALVACIADYLGIQMAMIGMGVVCFIFAVFSLAFPGVREVLHPQQPEDTPLSRPPSGVTLK